MIEVIDSGFHSLIQDKGRFGFQEFGVPVSGVLDADSYRLSNWLVGNSYDTEVLEITMTGPILKFYKDAVIGLTGSNMSPEVDKVKVPLNETVYVSAGSVLSFGRLKSGYRCYLSIRGGLGVVSQMKSKSTYVYAKIGGLSGTELTKGDIFQIDTVTKAVNRKVPKEFLFNQFKMMPIRVLEGPEYALFSIEDKTMFFSKEFAVSSSSNRMGSRLDGVQLDVPNVDMISSGVVPGVIQVPSSGKPIILLADAQTIGGYARIANVIKADFPSLAQQRPGDKIRFRAISLEEAQANLCNKEKRYSELFKL